MEKLLLSIVIPVYNGEKYIKFCLDAVLKQTYSNLEVIVVDDGSTDYSLDIVKEYAANDNRIKVLSHENRGVSYTRNQGIEVATGQFITFIDADDYPDSELAHNYIAGIQRWQEKDVSFLMCGMYFDNLYNKNIKNKKHLMESAHGYIEGECYLLNRSSAATLSWLELFNFVTNKCYSLDKINDYNIRFDEEITIGEDLKFNLDYLDKCPGNIGMKNVALYHYVKRCDDSLSISYHSQDLDDTKCIYKRFINWEQIQPEATDDNILVVKSIFIKDWVNRLTAYYEQFKDSEQACLVKHKINNEIKSREFQILLKEIRRGKKISLLRYICLRTGIYEVFYVFRAFYKIVKG